MNTYNTLAYIHRSLGKLALLNQIAGIQWCYPSTCCLITSTCESHAGGNWIFSTTRSCCICPSSVVPESGVTPSNCANLNTACAGVQLHASAMATRDGCDSSEGEPDNVQNDLDDASCQIMSYTPCKGGRLTDTVYHALGSN
jgi:hypothetical protein